MNLHLRALAQFLRDVCAACRPPEPPRVWTYQGQPASLPLKPVDDFGYRPTEPELPGPTLRMLADQIEAQTRPPKPPEPTGLGAVVEDAEGTRWIRTHDRLAPWCRQNDESWRYWPGVDAVRVLSEGVPS